MDGHIVPLEGAVELLKAGQVGVIPTDTVYGLVARAEDPQAVSRLYRLKDRERKPGTLIAADTSQLLELGVPKEAIDKVARWWPGPLSAVLIVNGREYLHQGLGDLAMRVTADTSIRRILEQTGPLITTSANHPGRPGSTTIKEATAYFGDRVDFYVDGGDLFGRAPSTIVRPASDGSLEVLRDGAVKLT